MNSSTPRHERNAILGIADFEVSPLSWLDTTGFPFDRSGVNPEDLCVLGGAQSPVTRSSHPSLTLAADVHLSNRVDLLDRLGLKNNFESSRDDRGLLLAAYDKWGVDCAKFLIGEFAFAIWDSRLKRLFCCRDHMGTRPFLYWRRGSRFVFASDVQTILSVPGVPRELNRRKLSTLAQYGGFYLLPEETFHSGILSLSPASWLTIDQTGLRQETYWKPEIRRDLVPTKREEGLAALRELLFQVVDAHADGCTRVGAYLSGGLDSSSVVSVLARPRKNGPSVMAFAGVLPGGNQNEIQDEREFIDEFCSWPNVRIAYASAEGCGPFDGIESPEEFGAWPVRISRHYLHHAIVELAAANGFTRLLGGVGGEWGTSSWGSRYYVELAFRLRWVTLLKELTRMKRKRSVSNLRFFASQCRPMLPGPNPQYPSGVFLAPEFPRSMERSKPWKCYWPDHRKEQAARIRLFQRSHAIPRNLPDIPGVRDSYPLLDKRILEFCLSAPGSWTVRDGYQRCLIRDALDAILPPKIQWRTTKTPFSPDYYVRYNRQLPKAREFVAAIGLKDPVRSVIDVERLGQALQPVDPRFPNAIARDAVPHTIYTICFLRQFPEFRG